MKRIYRIMFFLSAAFWFGCRSTAQAADRTVTDGSVTDETIKVVRADFPVRNLPGELAGKRIVFLSDLHFRFSNVNTSLLQSLPEVINRCRPDWILLGGDLVDRSTLNNAAELAPQLKRWVQRLKPRYGTYAVVGNHDFKESGRELYQAAGLRLLDDEFITDHGLLIGGLRDRKWEKPENQVPDVFRDQPRTFRILLCHRPNVLDKLPENYADLVLSGHNHGGVVKLPFIPDGFFVMLFRFRKLKYLHGWYEFNHNRMYVSSGIGGVGRLELRLGIPPEILCLTLTPATPASR